MTTRHLQILESDPLFDEIAAMSDEEVLNILRLGTQVNKYMQVKKQQEYVEELHIQELIENHINNINIPGVVSEQVKRGLSEVIKVSSNKGKLAEDSIYVKLFERFPSADFTQIRSESAAGDILMIYMGFKIMIEIKHYSRAVPGKEVDKFRRDLRFNDYDAGIMLSHGGIAHMKSDLTYQFNEKLAVFVSNGDIDGLTWAILFSTATLSKENQPGCDLQFRLDILRELVEDVSSVLKNMNSMKFQIIENLQNWVVDTEKKLIMNRDKIKKLISDIQNGLDNVRRPIAAVENTDLSKYTISDLRKLCDIKGVAYPGKANKDTLIALLT